MVLGMSGEIFIFEVFKELRCIWIADGLWVELSQCIRNRVNLGDRLHVANFLNSGEKFLFADKFRELAMDRDKSFDDFGPMCGPNSSMSRLGSGLDRLCAKQVIAQVPGVRGRQFVISPADNFKGRYGKAFVVATGWECLA